MKLNTLNLLSLQQVYYLGLVDLLNKVLDFFLLKLLLDSLLIFLVFDFLLKLLNIFVAFVSDFDDLSLRTLFLNDFLENFLSLAFILFRKIKEIQIAKNEVCQDDLGCLILMGDRGPSGNIASTGCVHLQKISSNLGKLVVV